MSNAGADIILGHHPHVLQPIERYTAPDGRQTLVAYSLGNFISGYWRPWGRLRFNEQASVILYVDITKRDGRTTISDVRYLPTVSVSRTRKEAKIIQVARLVESQEGSRATRLIEKSLHGRTGTLIWISVVYLAKNPFCLLLAASDVLWESAITLRLLVNRSSRRGQKDRRRGNN
jgi:poly-gamma-glutamate capsule biosynthesis protein CapA/YwtB (metallophosphatase superfamily)